MNTLRHATPEVYYGSSRPYVRTLVDAVPNMHEMVDLFVQQYWHYVAVLRAAVEKPGFRDTVMNDPNRRSDVYRQCLPATLQDRVAYEAAYAVLFGHAQQDRYGVLNDSYVRLHRGLRQANALAVERAQRESHDPMAERILQRRRGAPRDVGHAVLYLAPNEQHIEWENAMSSIAASVFLWIESEHIPAKALVKLCETWQHVAGDQVPPDMATSILRVFLVDRIPHLAVQFDQEDMTAAPEIWRQPIRQADILHALSDVDRLQALTNVAMQHE